MIDVIVRFSVAENPDANSYGQARQQDRRRLYNSRRYRLQNVLSIVK